MIEIFLNGQWEGSIHQISSINWAIFDKKYYFELVKFMPKIIIEADIKNWEVVTKFNYNFFVN